jgi:hypothetical protein
VRRPSPRAGTSTVEVLVCLLLMALLLQFSWSLLASARRTTARLVERSEALDTERLGWHVLSRETAAGLPGRDWGLEGERVLPLRAFRGVAEACAPGVRPDGGVVRFRGVRLAEPAKDSLLLLTAAGAWIPAKLTGREPGDFTCPGWPAGEGEAWSWEPAVEGVVLARVFERGSYHLEDRAIRYRVGQGGRQPLTEERLEQGSAFLPAGAGVLMRLRVRADEGVTWETRRPLPAEEGPDA